MAKKKTQKKKQKQSKKRTVLIIVGIITGIILATVITFLIISSTIVVDECAHACWSKMKLGNHEICEGPDVCIRRTLLDVILGTKY